MAYGIPNRPKATPGQIDSVRRAIEENKLRGAIEEATAALNRSRGGGSSGGSSNNNVAAQKAAAEKAAKEKAAKDKAAAEAAAQAELQRIEAERQRNIILAKKQEQYNYGQGTSTTQPKIPETATFRSIKDENEPTASIGLPSVGPTKSYKKRVGDKPMTFYTPRFGTLPTDSMGKQADPFIKEVKTAIELDYERDINRGIPLTLAGKSPELQSAVIGSDVATRINRKYQARVDSGELSVEDATAQAQADYEKDFSKELKKINQNKNLEIYKTVEQKRKETAVNIGKAALTLNPLGAVVLGAEASQRNEVLVLDKSGKLPLYPETRQTSPEAALYFGAGALGAVNVPFKYARQYDLATEAALKAKPLKFAGIETELTDKSIIKIVGKKKVSGAEQTIYAELPGYAVGDTRFSVQGGRATIKTKITPFLDEIRQVKNPEIISVEKVKIFGRGETLPTELRMGENFLKKVLPLTTKGEYGIITGGEPVVTGIKVKPTRSYLSPTLRSKITKPGKVTFKFDIPEEKVLTGRFGGLSRQQQDLTFVAGGKAKSLKIYPSGRQTYKYDLGQAGYLKKVNVKDIFNLESTSSSTVPKGSKSLPKTLNVEPPTNVGQSTFSLGQTALTEIQTRTVMGPTITETVTSPVIKSSSILVSDQKGVQELKTRNFQVTVQEPTTRQEAKAKVLIKQDFYPASRTSPKSISIPKTETVPRVRQDQKRTLMTNQSTKTQQKQQQKTSPRFFLPSFNVPRTPIRRPSFSGFIPLIILPKAQTYKMPRGLYGVEVRRGGKFRTIGTSRDLKTALSLGQSNVSRTLGASYRIKGLNTRVPGLSIPKGFYAKNDKKEGLIFIEKRSKRLSTGSEVSEIMGYKSIKKRKKSSRNGSKQAVSRRKKKKKGSFDDFMKGMV